MLLIVSCTDCVRNSSVGYMRVNIGFCIYVQICVYLVMVFNIRKNTCIFNNKYIGLINENIM